MNRVWTALLLVATVGVAVSVVLVLTQKTKVPEAGQTPGYSPTAGLPSISSPAPSPSSSSATTKSASSSAATTSTSTSGSSGKPVIAFLGDDYTLGIGATQVSDGFTELVGKQLNATVHSIGSDRAGYATSTGGGKDYQQEVAAVVALHPDLVVVTGGRNDFLATDALSVPSAAQALFTALHAGLPNAQIVAVSSFWGDSPHPAALDTIDQAVRTALAAAGGQYLQLPDPLQGHPEWMANAADPNNAGYAAIAAALAPKLRALLPTQ